MVVIDAVLALGLDHGAVDARRGRLRGRRIVALVTVLLRTGDRRGVHDVRGRAVLDRRDVERDQERTELVGDERADGTDDGVALLRAWSVAETVVVREAGGDLVRHDHVRGLDGTRVADRERVEQRLAARNAGLARLQDREIDRLGLVEFVGVREARATGIEGEVDESVVVVVDAVVACHFVAFVRVVRVRATGILHVDTTVEVVIETVAAGGRGSVEFVVVLAARAARILGEVDETVLVVVEPVLALALRVRFVGVRGRRTGEVVREVR